MPNAMETSYFAPTGPTQTKWYQNGYQAALRDIEQAFADGGEDAAREWLANNIEGVRTS